MKAEDVAVQAALAAGELLSERPQSVSHKGVVDLVTECDLRCEERIRAILGAAFPEIPVVGEERGGDVASPTRWIVDPIDGTTNFVHGFPSYAVSIGLTVDDEPHVGVIHDPVRGQTFRATRGHGAFCNDRPIRVSETRSLDHALCASGFAYDRRQKADFYLAFVAEVLRRARGFRRAGSAAMDLAWVAQGTIDAYWEFNLKPWDVAAGLLLVEEAGGRVSPIPGHDLHAPACPVATNSWLHEPMLALIGDVLSQQRARA